MGLGAADRGVGHPSHPRSGGHVGSDRAPHAAPGPSGRGARSRPAPAARRHLGPVPGVGPGGTIDPGPGSSGGGSGVKRSWIMGSLIVGAVIVLWEVGVWVAGTPVYLLPAPSDVARQLADDL